MVVLALDGIAGTGAARAESCANLAARTVSLSGDVNGERAALGEWAVSIWSALLSAYRGLGPLDAARGSSERGPTLAFVERVKAGAWYCPESDIVYVSVSLVDYAYRGRGADGADFLGFVLAHELAHRRFDRGAREFGVGCSANDPLTEARADRRAVFLLATARNPWTGRGFSPFELARRDSLAAFYEAELEWESTCPAVSRRLDAARVAIDRVGELAQTWDVALILAAAGRAGDEVALSLMEGLGDAAGADGWDAVPELKLLRAKLHLDRVAAVGWCPAGWPRMGLDPDPCTLGCQVLAPAYPRLGTFDLAGLRGESVDVPRELEAARVEIEAAKKAGLEPAVVAGVEVCHAYWSRAPSRGLTLLKHLEAWLGRAPPAVQAVVRANRVALKLQLAIVEEPAPMMSDEWHFRIGAFMPSVGASVGGDGGFEPVNLAIGTCPVSRDPQLSFKSGKVDIARRGACVDVLGARFEIAIEPLVLTPASRSLERWRAACGLGTVPLTADDGTVFLGTRCSRAAGDEMWVLAVHGDKVERALLVSRNR